MKIIGSKFWGEDAALCVLDMEKGTIFAINSDRVSRIKKDNMDISPIVKNFKKEITGPDIIAGPFCSFDGFDTCLENKGTSYFWLSFQNILRLIEKPRYYSDVKRIKTFFEKVKILISVIFRPLFFWHFFLWKFYMKKYLNGEDLGYEFHKKYCTKYIEKLFEKVNFKKVKPIFYDHHTSHAASTYYLSSFFKNNQESFVFTLDQQGDHTFSTLFKFKQKSKEEISRSFTKRVWMNNNFSIISIATIYSLFTKTLGLRENCDEGKVEALAAYGKPDDETLKKLNEIIFVSKNQKFHFDSNKEKFLEHLNDENLFKIMNNIGKENFSATIQFWLEEIVIEFLNLSLPKKEQVNLCLAGGVVANVILNYKIFERCNIKNLYICPPMGDEGSALGAALLAATEMKKNIDWIANYRMPYWGPSYNQEYVKKVLNKNKNKIKFEEFKNDWADRAAESLLQNKIIGVFQNNMEFGPRALGNRSILASATDPKMRDKINLSIKKRPKYQPFCPAVLEEDREKLFLNSFQHKFMSTAFKMKTEFLDIYPSAAHIDGTARPQFVEREDNENLYKILKFIKQKIGHGILINTSFNLHGRSMVMKPEDAIDDFLSCNLDILYLNGYEIKKI